MLRGLVFGAALLTAVGSTAYASQDPTAPQSPQAAPDRQEPQPDASLAKRTVAGIYLCEGANPDGSPYKGLVEIVAVDNTYLVHWMMADGAEVLGVGIRNRDVLSVSYFGGTPAVVVYRIDGDRLVGEWTMGGAEGMLYSETLTRMPDQKPGSPSRPQRVRPVAGIKSLSV
jgi:hypothetical protein